MTRSLTLLCQTDLTMPSATTTSHNGITTHHLDRDGVQTGTLTFGVGMRDESPTMAGITHLLEHAVLRLVQPALLIHGGIVKEDSVEFFASGTDDEVAHFLNEIARAISSISALTEEQLRLEKQIIEAENPRAFRNASSGLLSYRFGLRGIGITAFGAPTMGSLNRDEVVEWGQRWLTMENAALSFTGAVPRSLDVSLPSGPRIAHAPLPSAVTTPRLVHSSKAGVALSILLPADQIDCLGAALTYELRARLRHPDGLIYDVDVLTTRLDSDSCQLDLVLDPTESNVAAALRASVDLIRDLSEQGFSANAVESARSAVTSAVGWDRASGSVYLDSLAIDGLLDRVTLTHSELLNTAESLTSAQLTQILIASLPSLIVAVQHGAGLPKKLAKNLALPADRHNIWRQHRGERAEGEHGRLRENQQPWRGKSSKDRLWLTESHLLRREDGKFSSISLADIVVVGDRNCGCICLVDQLGRSTELDVSDWAHGKRLRRRVLDAFAPEITRAFPTDD